MGYRSGCFSTRLHDLALLHKMVNTFWIFAPPQAVKPTHIRVAPEAQVLAVDIDEQRLSRLRQFKTPWYEGDRETKVMAATLPNGVASNSLIAFY